MSEKKPASESYSRGFVRGEDFYVPGEEAVDSGIPTGRYVATCLNCRTTWAVPKGEHGLIHPEFNRFGERCLLAGTWVHSSAPVVTG